MNISLLEVLISLLLLSLVMLGVAVSNYFSMRTTQASYYLAAATQQINNLDDYLQTVHRTDLDNFVETWKWQTEHVLPHGLGDLHGTYPAYQVAVYWGGENADTCRQTKVDKQGCLLLQRT